MNWIIRMTIQLGLLGFPFFLYLGFRMASAQSVIFQISRTTARWLILPAALWWLALPGLYWITFQIGRQDQLFIHQPHPGILDFVLLYPFWFGLIFLLESVPFFLLLDFANFLRRIHWLKFPAGWPVWQAWVKILFFTLLLIYVPLRSWRDTYQIHSKPYRIGVKNLPVELQDLKIRLMGDIHVNRYTSAAQIERIRAAFQADSDFILFAGDIISRGTHFLPEALSLFDNPGGKLGNVACMGDHDYWTAVTRIPDELREKSWTFLMNRHHLFTHRGKQILITGITQIYSQRMTGASLRDLLQTAPEADLKILLVHQPMEHIVKIAAEFGYHLMVAGHTHGGQIVFHLFGQPLTPSQQESAFYSGQYSVGNLNVLVTPGTGLTLAPIRYHARSEISEITLCPLKIVR